MDLKRIKSALVILLLFMLIAFIGNKYVVDVIVAIVAIVALREYFNAFGQENKPLRWIGYVICAMISLVHVIPMNIFNNIIVIGLPILITLLFTIVVESDMKISLKNVMQTFFGIAYLPTLLLYVALLYGSNNGQLLFWFVIIASWGTDVFAYLVGKKFGKHKFSKVSPNKSIEGCIGGTVGSMALMLIYTVVCNKCFGLSLPYVQMFAISLVLSLIGQIGDFAASSIKRTVGIKDFSNLIPGHGGMIDRIDSVIFIAPFAYIFFSMVL